MNPPASGPARPGWFGKIPSLGDFATRRLPATFIEPWYEWLSAELSEARLVLGDTWPAIYEQAPISCFSLGSGTVDASAWHGILVPSFDRVGRQFPLTIAQDRPSHEPATMPRQWWAALVASGRRALERACGADGVEAALEVFTVVPEAPHLEPAPAAFEEGTSTWWAWSEDTSHPVACIIRGLPRAACFRKLLGAGQEPDLAASVAG
jgi:type VI secretion system protein ImpM